MCGRTTLTVPRSVLESRFDATVASEWRPRYNIAPGQGHPAITDAESETIQSLHWGLIPFWADEKAIGNRLINARAETVHEKNAFRHAFKDQRCLVVADGFYEWKEMPGGKQPYRIVREDEEPFAMAGLWDQWDGTREAIQSLTIITTDANDVVDPIHDRMPVMFEPDVEREWLSVDPPDAKSMLEPIDADAIRAYPVSKRVNNPQHDSPDVIEEVTGFDQSGLGDFGG